MNENELRYFCKKIEKNKKLINLVSKISNLEKAPTLNYETFLSELKKESENYPEAIDIYNHIKDCAETCNTLILEQKAQNVSSKQVLVVSFACYKTLNKEITSNITTSTPNLEIEATTKRRIGIGVLKILFSKSTIKQAKEKTQTFSR